MDNILIGGILLMASLAIVIEGWSVMLPMGLIACYAFLLGVKQ